MADLGNLMFRMGLNAKEFEKQMADELQLAKKTADEIKKMFADIKLPQMGGKSGAGGAGGGADNDKLEITSDLYKKLANRIAIVAEQQKKLEINSRFGYNGKYVQDAIDKLEQFKEKLESGLLSGSKKVAAATMRLFPNQDYALLNKQVGNMIREGDKLNRVLGQDAARQKKTQEESVQLITRSNSHLSITRNLVGQVGSLVGSAFSVYALRNFISDLVRIRGEFDAQYTALKAILRSGQQASELFSQLKTLAPISPYQFKDLAAYAKQLSAYSIPYNELFDTTKRLADLSSGLGVDFGRITLAYGQVRSAAVLRGQELRQFTEAGIPMVDELAKKFTKLKGEVVSAGDVFELISERQVPFQMVKEVIDDLTNEGGKFYMMQEKQAETLKGKVSNLADRYDIMMNSLGEANDGVLKGTVDALAAIMEHANLLVNAIEKLAAVWGLYKLATTMQTVAMGKNIAVMTAEEAKSRVKHANLLREAQLYRDLTAAEKEFLAKRGTRTKLSSDELGELTTNRRITQSEALRLAYLGKINKYTLGQLAANEVITQQQMQQVLLARQQAVSWLPKMLQGEKAMTAAVTTRLAVMKGLNGLMSGLGAIFSPANIAMMGISAALTALAEYKAEREKMAQDAAQIAANAKEKYEEIRKFIADNPIELVVRGGDNAAMKEMVKRYVEEIQKGVPQPLANNIVSSIYADKKGKARSLKDQVERAKELAEAMSQAAQYSFEYNKLFINAADKENGWFNDSLATNLKEAATEFQEFKSALYGLDKIKILNALEDEGLGKMGKEGKILAEQLKDGKSSMDAIFSTVMKMYAKSEQYNKPRSGIDKTFHFDSFLDKSGLRDILDQYQGSLGTFGYKSAADDVTEEAKDVAERFKNSMIDAGIDPMSDAGRIYAEQMKKSFFENAEVADEHIQNLFSFAVDSTLYGNQATAFKILGTELGGALTDGARQAVNSFKETGEWSVAMEAAVNEAKEKVISKYPELKDELEKAWRTPKLQVLISTELGAQQMDAWKKYMMDVLGDKYDIAIKMTTNVKEAQDAIQKVYDDARAFIAKQKPLQVKLGVAWNTKGVKNWIDRNQYIGDQTTVALMKQIYKAFQTVDEGKAGIDRGWISTDKSDKKDNPKSGSQKDKVTEALQKTYDSQKKALQKFNELRKTVSDETAKGIIKKDYGIELQDSWLTQFGQLELIVTTLGKLGNRATDAAKNFRKSLNDEKSALLADKDIFGYSVIADNLSRDVELLEKRFKSYDDFFKKSGNANLSALIAFGDQTKPYKDIVAATKAEFRKALDGDKGNKLNVEDLLGMSDEDIKQRLPEKFKTTFDKLKTLIANGNENARSMLETVFSKTDDEDVKIAVNNANKEELLNNLSSLLFGDTKELSAEQQAKLNELRPMIEDYYNNLNKELTLDKIKKSMNWEELFGDIGSLSVTQLDMLISQLEKIVEANNDLDPQKMKEWVNQLQKLKDARAQLNPYVNIFKGAKAVHDARKNRDNTAAQISQMSVTRSYQEAQNKGDIKAMKELGDSMVTLNGETMTYTAALKALSAATETYKKLQTANAKNQDWLINLGNKLWGGEDSEGNPLSGFSEDFANSASIFGVINQNAQSMDEFRKTLGIGDNTAVGRITSGIAGLSGGISSAFQSASSGDIFGALNGITTGFMSFGSSLGNMFGWGTKESDPHLAEDIGKLTEVNDNLTSAIQRLTEVMENASYQEYDKYYQQQKEAIEQQAKNTQEEMSRSAAASKKSNIFGNGGHKSSNKKINAGMSVDDWATISEAAGTSVQRAEDFFGLTSEQMYYVSTKAAAEYEKLKALANDGYKDAAQYMDTYVDYYKQLRELEDQRKQEKTSTTADELADTFASALDSMDDLSQTFADNFTKTLRNAIIQAFVSSTAMKSKIQSFYDKMSEYAANEDMQGDSIYTDSEWKELQGMWNDLGADFSKFQDTLKNLGVYADQTSSGLSGSIQSITEETADLLASYVNAIRADVAFIRSWYAAHFNDNSNSDTITTISVAVAQIEVNTRRSADNTDEIINLFNSVMKTTTNGKALRIS